MRNKPINAVFSTSPNPNKTIFYILDDLMKIVPDSTYLKRKNFKIRQMIAYLKRKKIKNLIIIHQNHDKTFKLLHFETFQNFLVKYKIVSIILRNNVGNCGKISIHKPELLFANFKCIIDHTIGMMMKELFGIFPDFKGRQILTLYKKKKFLFIRFHRYIFSITGKDVKLQELGPKITLKFENFFSISNFFEKFL